MTQDVIDNGHPGNVHTTLITGISGSAALHFTGSNFGYGSCMTQGSFDGTIELTGGGIINGTDLIDGVIYELSVAIVTPLANGQVYMFKQKDIFEDTKIIIK